jgi:hypothetical protein
MFIEFVSLGDPSRRMFDDGAGMHEFVSLWFGLDLVDLAMVCSTCEAWVHVWLQVGCL